VLKEGLAAYRTALRTHHQTPPPIAATQFIFVDTDQERALAEAQETIGRFVRMVASAVPPEIIAALPPTDAIRMAYERLVSMIDHVPERAIIGTPEDCRRRLAAIHAETGIEHILLYLHAGARDLTRARRGLELFAREVMPVLQ
jgi:alkanesulfonate monooxygenase SsuD/methylene tetrahydromethanopterin reductase-like flavin-dependent oxidoreductase (luciferase family)